MVLKSSNLALSALGWMKAKIPQTCNGFGPMSFWTAFPFCDNSDEKLQVGPIDGLGSA